MKLSNPGGWVSGARLLLGLALLSSLAACSQGPVLSSEASTEFAAQGLQVVQSSGFEQAYARPGAGLSSYRSIDAEKMSVADVHISHTTAPGTMRRDWLITPEREANVQAAWAQSMDRAFANYPSAAAGAKILRITAALTRLDPGMTSSAGGGLPGSAAGTSSNTVDVSVEFRFYDQGSGDLLVVIRDRRTIPTAQWSRAAGVDMVNLFGSWAALLHTRVSGQ
ncbi:MAG: hypothetical protein V7700_01775 [Halioglobus sp.]